MAYIPHETYYRAIDTALDVEEKLHAFNYYRELCLQNSDWTQSNDSPLSETEKAKWAIYRQELRDITNQTNYPNQIIWPLVPEQGAA